MAKKAARTKATRSGSAKRRTGGNVAGTPPSRPTATQRKKAGYLHGYTATEQERLRAQARVTEPMVHDRLPFRRCRHLLEVGAGVGAQTEILLRHFPDLYITGVEHNRRQITVARRFLDRVPWARGRYEMVREDAMHLSFERDSFDGAFLCWILEHVPDPARVIAEVRRVCKPGSPVVLNEVLNSSFFVDPYSPNTWKYWMAYNDHQVELGGDPFVGAKLGNLLQANGFQDIRTDVKNYHLDNREPGERAEFLAFWTDMLLSGADQLVTAGRVSKSVVKGMKDELDRVGHDPNSVFFYSYIQARARA